MLRAWEEPVDLGAAPSSLGWEVLDRGEELGWEGALDRGEELGREGALDRGVERGWAALAPLRPARAASRDLRSSASFRVLRSLIWDLRNLSVSCRLFSSALSRFMAAPQR